MNKKEYEKILNPEWQKNFYFKNAQKIAELCKKYNYTKFYNSLMVVDLFRMSIGCDVYSDETIILNLCNVNLFIKKNQHITINSKHTKSKIDLDDFSLNYITDGITKAISDLLTSLNKVRPIIKNLTEEYNHNAPFTVEEIDSFLKKKKIINTAINIDEVRLITMIHKHLIYIKLIDNTALNSMGTHALTNKECNFIHDLKSILLYGEIEVIMDKKEKADNIRYIIKNKIAPPKNTI